MAAGERGGEQREGSHRTTFRKDGFVHNPDGVDGFMRKCVFLNLTHFQK
jgi:hypothetical protein